MNKINVNKSLFMRQSYIDAWDDYQRSLLNPNFITWDYVILTASNEDQAEMYRMQLKQREQIGLLPGKTHFAVIPDPAGKRVGSGGATLNVLKYIAEIENCENPFKRKRILVIHSGGDSKRVPQYSACGKLFSPVPRELPNGKRSTLFDEFIIGMSGVPGRIKEGMLLLSGDVLLLFNPLQIDFSNEDAAAISFKEYVETGKNHGVFLMDENGNVGEFLHKQSVEMLASKGAVNEQDMVDIDTGAIIFSSRLLNSLFELIGENGSINETKLDKFVNEKARLSLYGDFLFPLAVNSTEEQYMKESPEGEMCDELIECRKAVWQKLNGYNMKLLRLSPAEFIHFGTTRELRELMTEDVYEREFLDWSPIVSCNISEAKCAAHNVVLQEGTVIGECCYFENSFVQGNCKIGDGVILSGVTVSDRVIPSDVVLHGLKQKNGKFVVRIYGTNDNPKETFENYGTFLCTTIARFAKKTGADMSDLWRGKTHDLWTAEIYPECDTMEEALSAALNVYEIANGAGDIAAWKKASRTSLYSSFNNADTSALLEWNTRIRKIVKIERMMHIIDEHGTVEDAKKVFSNRELDAKVIEWAESKIPANKCIERMRLYYYIGKIIGGRQGETYIEKAFKALRDGIFSIAKQKIRRNECCRICRESVKIALPLRVNWGGGWSDTPPYCNEHGGTVLNAAISVNGILPVEVEMRKISEKGIRLSSTDIGVSELFTDIEALQNCTDPYDSLALHKASLLAAGIIPCEGGVLDEVIDKLESGFELSTRMINIPKGSGLGTSSILAAACMKAISEFTGLDMSEDELYEAVTCAEQLMSTGGGWQDQVGGMTNGIKLICSHPGIEQKLCIRHIEISDETKRELSERFVLVYTGQRRLARNLLRDVVGKYIGNVPDSLFVLNEIQRVAALMCFELERGDVDAFAQLLNTHWELSKKLDGGSSNTCIDQIFLAIDDLIDGRMICGAGGGGFLQVILKEGITNQMLQDRLHSIFQDCGVDVWKCEIVF